MIIFAEGAKYGPYPILFFSVNFLNVQKDIVVYLFITVLSKIELLQNDMNSIKKSHHDQC